MSLTILGGTDRVGHDDGGRALLDSVVAVGPRRDSVLVTALYPEHWDFTARWPVPLALARDAVRQKIVASVDLPDGCEALGWVIAGL